MKRIFYYLASAIVALGAVACQNDIDEQINGVEGNDVVTFNVAFDETRIAVDMGDTSASFTFEEDDKLYVKAGNGEKYYEFTNTADNVNQFSCQSAALVAELDKCNGNAYVYSRESGIHDSSLAGMEGLLFYTGTANLSPENTEAVELTLDGAVFHFTVPANSEVVLSAGEHKAFYTNGAYCTSVTYTAGEADVEYFVQADANTYTLSYTIDGKAGKSVEKKWEANTIYNLGTLTGPVATVNGVNYTDLQKAINAASAASTAEAAVEVKLTSRLSITNLFTVSGNVTIKGAGTTNPDIYGDCDIFKLTDGATLTLEDMYINSMTDCGIFTSAGANNVTVNITNSTVRSSSSGYAAIQFNGTTSGVTLNVSGESTISNYSNIAIYLPAGGEYNFSEGVKVLGRTAIYLKGGELNITGGTFSGQGYKKEYSTDNNGAVDTGDVIVIESSNYPAAPPTANISGGTFTFSGTRYATKSIAHYIADGVTEDKYATINVTGGTFATDPTESVADGYKAIDNGDGTYTVREWNPVAKVGETEYEDLAEAITAANGNVVTLLANGTVSQKCVINKNGYTLTVTGNFLALKNYNNDKGYYDVVAATTDNSLKLRGSWDSYNFATGYTLYDITGTTLKVAASVEFTKGATFKVGNSSWGTQYGANTIPVMDVDTKLAITNNNGADFVVTTAGTYNFYFDTTANMAYLHSVESAKQYSDASATSKTYLKPNSNWTQSSAWFAAYFLNNTTGKNQWVKMTKQSDGSYACDIPEGTWENVIYCRMNSGMTTPDWGAMWNQTGDLYRNNVKGNTCAINAGQWNCGQNVTWSTK